MKLCPIKIENQEQESFISKKSREEYQQTKENQKKKES